MAAAIIPILRLPEAAAEIYPTRAGPPEHPRSPPKAISANMAVPPFFISAEALLKLPGHMIPTDSPQTAQPARDKRGDGDRLMHK